MTFLSSISKGKPATLSAIAIILTAAVLMVASSWDDSPAFDEVEHLTAGYYYVTQQNYRFNCCHPPLAKDLAGLAILLVNPKPGLPAASFGNTSKKEVLEDFVWKQPDVQTLFRLARLPLILVSVAFLVFYYRRVKLEFGSRAATIALTMLAFSPTFLAHSRFVGNDGAIAACLFVSIFLFLDQLRQPNRVALLKTSFMTGIALLVKFSGLLLFPMYCLIALIGRLVGWKNRLRNTACDAVVITGVSMLVLWVGYDVNMLNFPSSFQHWYNGTRFHKKMRKKALVMAVLSTSKVPILRPYSWYLTGLAVQTLQVSAAKDKGQKTVGYLMGSVYTGGNASYFPILIATKEPLGFIILALIAVPCMILTPFLLLAQKKSWSLSFKKEDLPIYASIAFVAVYLFFALRSNLNIGIRHILPIYPFVYMLTAVGLVRIFEQLRKPLLAPIVFVALLSGCVSSMISFPGYLSYYNEMAGGKQGGRHITVDSNFDWGVDLYRLKKYVDKHQIPKIYVFYFGSGMPEYYLGSRYQALPNEILPSGEYLAVSVQFLEQANAMLRADKNIFKKRWDTKDVHKPGYYSQDVLKWMTSLKPVAVAGDSIYIFKTP